MLADLSISAALILAFCLGVGSGRWLHQQEQRRERQRIAARCRNEVAPMVRAWLDSHSDITVAATAVEIRKYVRFHLEDVVEAVRVTLDRFVEEGSANRVLEPGVICGGYFVYRSTREEILRHREIGGAA